MLVARGIKHRYNGGEYVLVGIDLTVEAGERVAIMGPSGSGKTTLLAILGGLIEPTEGTVTLNGSPGAVAEHVSWVLQTANLLPDRSALDNAALGALAGGATWRQALDAAQTAISLVGLKDLTHRTVRLLSGGEAQRVVIARALASPAPLLLADEPTGQLDAHTTDDVLGVLVADHGRTVVVVTHDSAVADRCDRTVRLVNGRAEP